MKQFAINQAKFVTSVGQGQTYPAPLACEIAVVGRSNVGKSSLINCLTNNGKLAKTSQTPGKTRLVNYFLLNNAFYLVDLPGYGFAKRSKDEQTEWGNLIGSYMSSGRPKHLLLLVDIRHEPSPEDREMFRWTLHAGVPFTIVATKADKIGKSQRVVAANKAAKLLGAPAFAIPFSAEEKIGKDALIERIGQIFADAEGQAQRAAEQELLFASAELAFAEAEAQENDETDE
ncbi:MAG: YihA family ribosome biogenesis GTP-binding protein [Firmicutes bacterium HGW-Firmicutes-9]|jgi:GTP-binding protein|nr:MAG: YihA family ribosome biogenesis GTP-binding protein [Firmicutes bacterium HGW-Firmicutes-9]